MVGSKNKNKQDIFGAAKNLTELLGEMGALLSMTGGGSGKDEHCKRNKSKKNKNNNNQTINQSNKQTT
jgi:hypothetical protein